MAIVDAVPVGHYRPIGNGGRRLANGKTPLEEGQELIAKYRRYSGTGGEDSRMKILIGALQAVDHFARLVVCRDLDGRRGPARRRMRVPGGAGADQRIDRPTRSGDLLLLPCPNDYGGLPQRTRWFCRWAIDAGGQWDYLFKCDSDTYVSVPRLLAYCGPLQADPASVRRIDNPSYGPLDYLGAEWKPGVGYGSGGGGYLLSRRAAAVVAEEADPRDRGGGPAGGPGVAAERDPLSSEPRFVPFGSMEQRPKRANDLITTHKVGPDVFWKCHEELSN